MPLLIALITGLFVGLKLTGVVAWSWWLVWTPFLVWTGIVLAFMGGVMALAWRNA